MKLNFKKRKMSLKLVVKNVESLKKSIKKAPLVKHNPLGAIIALIGRQR